MSSAWWGNDVSGIDQPPAVLNGEYLMAVNAAGTGTIPLIGADASNNVIVGGNVVAPTYKTVVFRSGNVGIGNNRKFWISDGFYTVVGMQEIHAVAESTALLCLGQAQKTSGGVTTGLLTGVFNLKGAANTLQTGTLTTVPGALNIQPGDSLNWQIVSAGTELSGVCMSVLLAPGNKGNQATFYFSGTMAVDNCFFVANRPMTVVRIDYMHSSASSGVCNMQVTIDSAGAPGTGTDILTNNANAGFDCQAAINTVQSGILGTATRLNPGDRLSADFSGTTTGLAGGVLTVSFAPSENRREAVYNAVLNAGHVDAGFFIADRPYQVELASAVWSTAGGAGANAQLTVDSGTQAPGAGLDLLSNDSNAGFQIDGTANTVEVGTFQSAGRNFLQAGDRLGIDFTATATIVGFVCTVTLRPA
jgi:hypothetical protein